MISVPRGGKRPGAGRPKKPAGERLGETLLLRHTNVQATRWLRAARARNKDLAVWIREACDVAAGLKVK